MKYLPAAVLCQPRPSSHSHLVHKEPIQEPVASRFGRSKRARFKLATRVHQLWGTVLIVSLTVSLTASRVLGGTPDLRFDTANVVSCRDVTTPEFEATNPSERLVEGCFRISAIVQNGMLPDDVQYSYQIVNPSARVQIIDYQPQTMQTTTVAGNVTVEKTKETNKSLGLSLSGGFQPIAQGTAGADLGSKDISQIRYELKPPMEVVLVAGTMDRGTGVYFKLRPSPDESLEGAREFRLVMRVPPAWRGDMMYVRCEAQQQRRGGYESLGITRFVVGLFAQGDEQARQAAEELVRAEATLRRSVVDHRRDIQKRSIPTVVHQVGAWLDMYHPRIPDTWLERLIYGSTNLEQYEFYGYLPRDIRQIAEQYRQAKRQVYRYSGARREA